MATQSYQKSNKAKAQALKARPDEAAYDFPVLTLREVCELTGWSRGALELAIANGRLHAENTTSKPGRRRYKMSRRWVDDFLKGQKVEVPQTA